jgi:hypothetical protein
MTRANSSGSFSAMRTLSHIARNSLVIVIPSEARDLSF